MPPASGATSKSCANMRTIVTPVIALLLTLSGFAGSFIGSALQDRGVIPTITSIGGGPVFSASSTNLSWPVTNYGVVYSTTEFTGSSVGNQYQFSFPSNYQIVSLNNFTPEIAGFVGNQTTWVTNGLFRYRIWYKNAGGFNVSCSGNLNIGYLTDSQSVNSFSNYVAGSLGNDLFTNVTALTNGGRDGIIWDSISSDTWTWHSNSLIYGKHGYTGLSQMSSFNAGFPWKFTAITRRHAYSAGHVFGPGTTNGYVYFIGSDGAKYSAFATNCRQRFDYTPTYDDYCIVFFSQDLPATVQPLKVCVNTNVWSKLQIGKVSFYCPTPLLETCQHGRIGSQSMNIFDNHPMHVGGDSGNPAFFIHGTNLVNYQGTSGSLLSTTNFINDMNALTTAAGLSTNDYQPTYFDLSGYPDY